MALRKKAFGHRYLADMKEESRQYRENCLADSKGKNIDV